MQAAPNPPINTPAEPLDAENVASSQDANVTAPPKPVKKYKFIVKVTALERVGSTTSQRENPIVVFDVSTDVPTFRKQQHRGIKKSTDEFKELFRYLVAAVQETFVPALPAPCSSYGPNTDEDRSKTMRNYQEWLERIAADPLLLRNEEVAFFVQSDFGTYSPINSPPMQPATGLKRRTLKQLAPPYDEVVELAEFRPLVKSIHHVSQDAQSKLVKVSKQRRILAQEETELGLGFAALQNDAYTPGGPQRGLQHSGLYKRFGRVLAAAGDVDSVVSTLELATLADPLGWLVKDTYVVKEALTNRHLIMRELLQAQQSSRAKQEHARKLRAKRDASPIKVDEALRSLRAATQFEQDLTNRQRRITGNMLLERTQWLQWYETFIAAAIKEFTLRKIEYERKKLTLLERVRHDVRRADTAGGLSRLGRESHPQPSTFSPKSSQRIDGDEWAGDHRRRSSLFIQQDALTNTDFDRTLAADEQDFKQQDRNDDVDDDGGDVLLADKAQEGVDRASLDARNAASLLGLATF